MSDEGERRHIVLYGRKHKYFSEYALDFDDKMVPMDYESRLIPLHPDLVDEYKKTMEAYHAFQSLFRSIAPVEWRERDE